MHFIDECFCSHQDANGARSVPQQSTCSSGTHDFLLVANEGHPSPVPLESQSFSSPSPLPSTASVDHQPFLQEDSQPSNMAPERETADMHDKPFSQQDNSKSSQPESVTSPLRAVSSSTHSSLTESSDLQISVPSSSFTFLRPARPSHLCKPEPTVPHLENTSSSSTSSTRPFLTALLPSTSSQLLVPSVSTQSSLGAPPSSAPSSNPSPPATTGYRAGHLLRFIDHQVSRKKSGRVSISVSTEPSSPSPPAGSESATSRLMSSSSITSFDGSSAMLAGEVLSYNGSSSLPRSSSKKDTLLIPSMTSTSSIEKSASSSPSLSRQVLSVWSLPSLSPPLSPLLSPPMSPPISPPLSSHHFALSVSSLAPLVPAESPPLQPSTVRVWDNILSSLHMQQHQRKLSGLSQIDDHLSSLQEASPGTCGPSKVTLIQPPLSFPLLSYNTPNWCLLPKKEVCRGREGRGFNEQGTMYYCGYFKMTGNDILIIDFD